MARRRWTAVLVVALLGWGPLLISPPASAEPIDSWEITHGIDCVADRFNPVRPDGTRDPAGDPEPGTAAWEERDDERLECARQRDHDRRFHPHYLLNSARYGEDWYRQPVRFDGRRFRLTSFPLGAASDAGAGIPGVQAAEVYRPCAPGTCGSLPADLERFEPPYPVVVIFHGAIAQLTHHRFNSQVYAEAGYMTIAVNSTHPVTGAPDFSNTETGEAVLDWLHAQEHPLAKEADLNRVAFAGHSQGAGVSLQFQNDPRVHTIVAWDGGDSISDNNCTVDADSGELRPCTPIMYQRTDGAFSAPQNSPYTDYPENRHRGLTTYEAHTQRGIDVFHVAFRATSHIDWNGNGVGSLAGNRLAEPLINYYTLAWIDRHLKGKLALDAGGDVITVSNRDEAAERAYRQAQAQGAFDRLTAMRFPAGSIDKHNVSQGFYDPVQMATSGDPLYGGNVPYTIEGLFTTDRFSTYYRSFCSVSVPDYVNGSDGSAGSSVAARADSGSEGDLRFTGCPTVG